MKKIFLLLFIISMVVTGCNDNDNEESDLTLSTTSVEIFKSYGYGYGHSIQVSGGSGKYSATINPNIAEIDIDSENSLFIYPMKNGEAVITVIDDNSGKSIDCSLTILDYKQQFKIVEILYLVDAGVKDVIEADLLENTPFTIGSSFIFSTNSDAAVVINDPDDKQILSGTHTSQIINNIDDIPEVYKTFPPDNQILGGMQRIYMVFGENSIVFDKFTVKGLYSTYSSVIVSPHHFFFYEDLTDYYKDKYPEAEVKGVARAYITGEQIFK